VNSMEQMSLVFLPQLCPRIPPQYTEQKACTCISEGKMEAKQACAETDTVRSFWDRNSNRSRIHKLSICSLKTI
jgi:hypothetical protein